MMVLDYSAGHFAPELITQAGHSGALRYLPKVGGSTVDTLDSSEVAAFREADVPLALVYEDRAPGWMLGGAAVGDSRALWILQQCEWLGIGRPRCVYLADDSHHTEAEVVEVMKCLAAAQKVLGDATGIYGFRETIRAAVRAGLGHWRWLTGSQPTPDEVKAMSLHLYQRNYGIRPVISGVECDVNNVYQRDWGQLWGRGTTMGSTLSTDDVAAIVTGIARLLHLPSTGMSPAYGTKDNADFAASTIGGLQASYNRDQDLGRKMGAAFDAIGAKLDALQTQVTAITGTGDTAALSALVEAAAEAAVRKVLGSVDNG